MKKIGCALHRPSHNPNCYDCERFTELAGLILNLEKAGREALHALDRKWYWAGSTKPTARRAQEKWTHKREAWDKAWDAALAAVVKLNEE